ncbi:heterokaryon incompatibility protein-domain-containing protein, partial [Podospora didyma]
MAHDSSRLTGTTTPLHTPLRKGSVRLLRLLPNSNQNSPIECQLITFSMLDTGSTHPYECLSYVWGSNSNKQPIYVDGCKLHVTANLHAALSHLRHCFLERILWVDAICINQDDNDEKGQQVQLMAKIYAKASRVVVWLGEAADSSDYALEAIRAAADEQLTNFPIDEENRDTILTLLERGWFERIWVLQEVAAARHILIKCGPVEMDGYVFCSGLSALNISYETRPHLLGLIPPILYLIRGAVFRPRSEGNETSRQDRFSLNIRPLGQLVDMYHTHKATIRHDKVYALLGMSNDEPSAAGLEANYEDPWREAFRKLVHFCLSDRISVCTWDSMEAAVIEGKGYILGEVSSAGQDVNIAWKDAPSYFERREQSSCFTLQASAKAAKRGDIVCLLQGALRPTIIRPCDEFSTVVMIAVPLIDNDLKRWSASVTTFPVDLLMVWNWNESQRELQGGEDYGKLISSRGVPECPIADCQCPYGLDKAIRLWNFGLFLNRMERYGGAITNFQRAVEVYGSTVALGSVDRKYLGHGSRKRADEEALRIMDDLYIDDKVANIRRKYEEYSQNPLSWAAENGQEAIVRMMIGNGANIEAKGQNSWAPLMR